MTREELEKKVEEIETRAAEKQAKDLEEKRTKTFYGDNFKMNNTEVRNDAWQQFAQAMIEKRALSLQDSKLAAGGGEGTTAGTDTGRITQVSQLWDLIRQKEPLLDMVSYFNGPDWETQIPVLEARPAVPSEAGEGWDGSSPATADAIRSADIAVKKINPKTYVAILPITYEAAKFSFLNLESRIPGLLAEAYRTAMCAKVFAGIFNKDNVGNQIATASASAVSIKDLLDLALAMKDTDIANPVMVMNQGIYSAIAAANADGYDFVKEELVRNKSVEGVKVILSGKAPVFGSASAGDIVVFGGDLKNFALGVADQISIEPLKKLGSSNTFYQSIAAFDGIMVQPKNVYGLKKASL